MRFKALTPMVAMAVIALLPGTAMAVPTQNGTGHGDPWTPGGAPVTAVAPLPEATGTGAVAGFGEAVVYPEDPSRARG
jgi:hypothetical protein